MHTDLDMEWLIDLTRRAGDTALEYFGKATASLKADDSWVTEADLAIEQFIREKLRASLPDDYVIGEEGDKVAPPTAHRVWAIDPIDGTRAFYHGFPIWGVSVGLIVEGRPHAGVFVLPAIGDLYHTDGQIAYLNGSPLPRPSPKVDVNAVFLISEGAYQDHTVNYTGKVLSLGSAAAHLCYVARGSAVGAMDRAGVWDYAAGAAILSVLGIQARYVSGSAVVFSDLYDGRTVSEPTLFAADPVFETLQNASSSS
ncbi:MAG: inositol-phosphate phosphatase [Gemmatimonadetes bacterium]|nr:inositol-phosphate phosphatase [Gemmatimonadota bacterium]|tara:strand:+ start:1537 stop:2301 length:765 start_codon:yes stop_codon:yes gene_type:complete